MTETFTDSLRRRLLEASNCPACGQPVVKGGIRALSERIGVGHTTLWRFLSGARPGAETIDAIVRFLGGPV